MRTLCLLTTPEEEVYGTNVRQFTAVDQEYDFTLQWFVGRAEEQGGVCHGLSRTAAEDI